jgi:hypothetical protein
MGIAGAALYSLGLIACLKLARLLSLTTQAVGRGMASASRPSNRFPVRVGKRPVI